jgi:serine/threonine protein kinase
MLTAHELEPASHRLLEATPRHRVYAARWPATGEDCVLKTVPAELQGPRTLASLRAEAHVLQLLEDAQVQGVPRLLQFDAEAAVLVETRIPGRSLAALPAAWFGDVPGCLHVAIELAAILDTLHRAGVFHGDLQPANILFDPVDEQVGLVDFGDSVAGALLEVSAAPGPPDDPRRPFIAPEQTGRSGRAIDSRSDCYALGAVLHWMLTGQPPFDERDPSALLQAVLTQPPPSASAINRQVGKSLQAVLAKLMSKAPEERYQSAHGVRSDLYHCLAVAQGRASDKSFAVGREDHGLLPTQPSRLIGREAAFAALTAALRMPSERARVVLIRGAAGIGKTALVQALQPLLAAKEGRLALGQGEPFVQPMPFGAVGQAFSALASAWPRGSPLIPRWR